MDLYHSRKKNPVVAVALSGGVDSAVAAHLLQQEGYSIFGLFMKNWEEKKEDGTCTSQEDYEDVVQVCEALDIPYYVLNFSLDYKKRVFSAFLRDIQRGLTPNPDTLCNREIKFDLLYKKARALGADFLATGHYCRVKNGSLMRGLDNEKDQSYFLYSVKGEILQRVLFPLGSLKKETVRYLAKQAHLPVFAKKESMGICFIGKKKFRPFLSNYLRPKKGMIQTVDGKVVGTHHGVVYYTIGQRKGLGIGGTGDPYFVVKKETKTNVLWVAQGKNHPALFADTLFADTLSWIGPPPSLPFRCHAKIRYRQDAQPCKVDLLLEGEKQKIQVTFDRPQRAITEGQAIVFYRKECCLGGGVITHVSREEALFSRANKEDSSCCSFLSL